MNSVFTLLIVFGFINFLFDILLQLLLEQHEAKKCKYDCSKCGNWRCYSNWCKKKREESE